MRCLLRRKGHTSEVEKRDARLSQNPREKRKENGPPACCHFSCILWSFLCPTLHSLHPFTQSLNHSSSVVMSTPTTNSENTTMPPPPPRPAMVQQRRTSEPASSIVIPRMAAPATAVETSLDGEGNMTCASPATSINHDRHPLKRRATISSSHHPLAEHGLPPRPPPAKRTRMALETTDKENTVNYANDEDEDEEELVYNGPLEDPEQASGDDDKTEQDSVITAEIDSMMQMGLQAFQDRERLQQENNFLKDDNAAKALEISRLRTALKQKQEIIAVRVLLFSLGKQRCLSRTA